MQRSYSDFRSRPHQQAHRAPSSARQLDGAVVKAEQSPLRARASKSPKTTEADSQRPLTKSDLKKMAQQFATRLQYAAFKVERGWTKHSLPEVENLYWQANRKDSATSKRASPSSLTSRPENRRPSQTSAQSSNRVGRTASGAGTAHSEDPEDVFGSSSVAGVRSSEDSGVPKATLSRPVADAMPAFALPSQHRRQSIVIGANGLPTPPPSAGTDVGTMSKISPSALRASPTRSIQKLRSQYGGAAHGEEGTANPQSTPRGVGASYADFWSKMGSSTGRDNGVVGNGLLRGPFVGSNQHRDTSTGLGPTESTRARGRPSWAAASSHGTKRARGDEEEDGDNANGQGDGPASRDHRRRGSEGPLARPQAVLAAAAPDLCSR
ncbi:unnamed protein product [Parajaminaea phylloscopi]